MSITVENLDFFYKWHLLYIFNRKYQRELTHITCQLNIFEASTTDTVADARLFRGLVRMFPFLFIIITFIVVLY